MPGSSQGERSVTIVFAIGLSDIAGSDQWFWKPKLMDSALLTHPGFTVKK
jgi:hypothetical protein